MRAWLLDCAGSQSLRVARGKSHWISEQKLDNRTQRIPFVHRNAGKLRRVVNILEPTSDCSIFGIGPSCQQPRTLQHEESPRSAIILPQETDSQQVPGL